MGVITGNARLTNNDPANSVVLINPATGEAFNTTPASNGAYTFPYVDAGPHLVTAVGPAGYRPQTHMVEVLPDPLASQVVVDAPFYGPHGTVHYTANGRVWTAFGNAKLSRNDSMFLGGSAELDGTGDYYTTPYTSNLNFLNNQLTIEAMVKPLSTKLQIICSMRPGSGVSGFSFYMTGTGELVAVAWNTVAAVLTIPGNAMTIGAWQHVAVTRGPDHVWRVFQQGVLTGSGTATAEPVQSSTPLHVGKDPNFTGRDWHGNIEGLRITTAARYLTTFPAYTRRYPT
jgi:hypothetical protein